ncbi:MAG: hypothetical protein IIV53_07125 [Bacteroidaceae bacterium]|nr:hypothetical protein [Bacteroidaceae bacterium]
MKDLLKFHPPKTARLNAAEYTNFIERFLSLTTACTTCRRRPPLRACCPAHHLGERCQDARQQVAPR